MKKNNTIKLIKQILFLWGFWSILRFLLLDNKENLDIFIVQHLFSLVGFIIVITINARFIIPNFYFKKKYLLYGLSCIALLIVTVFIIYSDIFPWGDWYLHFTDKKPPKMGFMNPPRNVKWLPRIAPLLIGFLGSTVVEIMSFARKKENEYIEAEKGKLETELKFLKSQINPHFLFNALNNIYSLSVTQSDKTSDSIMQLSEILRYMVYESSEAKVPLKSEINYVENFIDLLKLKDSSSLDIKVDLAIASQEKLIAPLLFIPFIENAFKHSQIGNLKKGFVHIELKSDKEITELNVANSVPSNRFTKDKVGGVGLENIKKRLALLYPNKHELTIDNSEYRFEIKLKIYS